MYGTLLSEAMDSTARRETELMRAGASNKLSGLRIAIFEQNLNKTEEYIISFPSDTHGAAQHTISVAVVGYRQ